MEQAKLIGVKPELAEQLAEKLNILLADYGIFYQNVRGFHWNIKGRKFFELHLKFEELYNDLLVKIDEVAERILTLGYSPEHRYSLYQEKSGITESPKITDGDEAVRNIQQSLSALISQQRELLELSGEAEDEGTNALMSDYIREQEKLVWMYTAYLG
ncbi:Dps family protein [Phaeodactylibacter luteus]|uniref:DNA starvation/stationary phase protection protein n=1 Tax=Phaeodactylibacter luteus TaxID=1564516 RepID=A0A5C6S344_9BACT|nr:Dps family protein [Phaeodactylibacter luteus]TXB68885.1 DNA starvation/stationary phase protection protein [Phaeodactylibacter luteus]